MFISLFSLIYEFPKCDEEPRFVGITQAKQKIARETGIPMTKSGAERKIGATIIKLIFGK